MSLRRWPLLAAAGVFFLCIVGPAHADPVADCLARRERHCVIELLTAMALAQADPMDRINALVELTRFLALDDEEEDARELMGMADALLAAIEDADARDDARVLLAQGHAQARDFAAAFAIADQVHDEERRAFARANVATEAAEQGEVALVEAFLPEANEQLADILKEGLAHTFAEADDWDRAYAVARTLALWNPDIARWICGELVARDRFNDAIRVFETIPAPVLREFAARGFVDGLIARGDFATARQMALAIRTYAQADGALVDVARGLARAGNDATADAVIAQIGDGETQGDGLVAIAAGRAERGDIAGALAVAERAAARPPAMRTPIAVQRLPRLIFDVVARTQGRSGDLAGALATAQRIAERSERELTLVAIARERLDAADGAGARAILGELLRTATEQPVTLSVVREGVLALARSGDDVAAAALAKQLPQAGDRAQVLSRAAIGSQGAGLALLVDAVGAAAGAMGPRERRAAVLANLAVLRARVGQSDAAAELLAQLDTTARTKALLSIAFPSLQPLP